MELKTDALLERGKYRIVRTLGRGGFGVTYLAEQVLAKRKVCIKEFFPKDYYKRDATTGAITLASDGFGEMMDKFKAKFIKEAQTIAALDHPNIIPIHDVFEENDTAYYVMEYIEGGSLQDVVRKRGALPTEEALALMNPVIDAVGYIHDHRIMHLDIKPGNIMVREKDGRPILIDFGLSKQYDEEGNQTSSTPVGISHGFAPIEQYQNGGVSAFSPQTDIYSLGATLYYLVSGTVPPQAAIVANEGLPELPATISANVRTAIEKAMEFRSKQRPESIAKLKQLLGSNAIAPASASTQIDGGSETAIEPKPQPEPKVTPKPEPKVVPKPEPKSVSASKPTEPKKKSKWWLWLLLLIVAGGAAAWFMSSPQDEPTPIPAEQIAIVADSIADANDQTAEEPSEEQSTTREEIQPVVIEEEEPTPAPSPVLRLTSNSRVTTEHSGTNGTIRYTLENPVSGVNISVSDNANWLTTSVSGSNISYTASANESQSSRTATITVRYGDQNFEVVITQNGKPAPTTGTANGHDWVNLGLPSGLKWATCNVGASNPGDYGNYYAWGETNTKNSYTWGNCSTYNQNISDIAGTSRDAARVNWGGRWRMPRASEIDELLSQCAWTWTTQNGNSGYKVTGPNGNSIFLPAAGYRDGSHSLHVGSYGDYWSSTPSESDTHSACYLISFRVYHGWAWGYRYYGYSVRPVLD